jgi:CubicO group peptidase (beta-lactamase class C family)
MKLLFYPITFLLISAGSYGQTQHTLSDQQIRQLDSISVSDVPKGAPGIASGVVLNGKIVYRKYAGYANLNDSSLIDAQSRFNIASNGKQFTAFAILLLAEQKKLSLHDDIRKFFPKLFSDVTEKISVEHLISHTSGIRDVYDLWALQGITWWKQTLSNTDVLDLLHQQRELNFKPGSTYAYSNSNYILLALIVEKVTGESFVNYTTDMFKKLNMIHTSFESDYQRISGPIARPYFNFDTWFGYNWICNIYGDGNIFSTLEDQLEWEKTIQTKKNAFYSKEIIEKSQQLTPAMYTSQYGYGLEFGNFRNLPYKFHEGSTGAWKATTIRFPNERVSIVTLTNSGKTIPSMQSRQLADVVLNLEQKDKTFRTKPESSGPFVSVNDVVGIYQNEDNFTFTIEKRDTSIFLLRSGRNDTRLEREAANIFHQWNDSDFKQEFTKNEKGELQVTAYYTSHAPYTLIRPLADWSKFDYRALEGSFHNVETDATFTLKYDSQKFYKVVFRGDDALATLVTPDKLIFNNYNLEVLKDSQGKVAALLLSADRIKNVRFYKKP